MLLGNPKPALTSSTSKTLLKVSVVGRGFGVNFLEVIKLGRDSLLLTLITIIVTMGLGSLLKRFISVPGNTASLTPLARRSVVAVPLQPWHLS